MIFTKDFPETNAMYAVNLVAKLLDRDNSGVVDSEALQKLEGGRCGVWLDRGTP